MTQVSATDAAEIVADDEAGEQAEASTHDLLRSFLHLQNLCHLWINPPAPRTRGGAR